MRNSHVGLRWAASLLLTFASHSQAIGISENKFKELGGTDPHAIDDVRTVGMKLQPRSKVPPFLVVGRLRGAGGSCTANWLGESGPHTYFITAAHCVVGASRLSPQRVQGRFSSWQGDDVLLANGEGLAFMPWRPRAGDLYEDADDVAVVRLPRVATPTDAQGRALTSPILYDGQNEVGLPLEFVAYGNWGVGINDFSTLHGRLWGQLQASRLRENGDSMVADYPIPGTPQAWAIGRPGDSGAGWWQRQSGYWTMVTVFSSAGRAGGMNFRSSGARISRVAGWVKGLFPGAMTLTDRLTVTDKAPFVSANHALDAATGTVYYTVPPQPMASGPTARSWNASDGHSRITVTVENILTRDRVAMTLRGQREHCWRTSMENGAICYDRREGPLIVSYRPEDNYRLPAGVYRGRFEVEAKGWHDAGYSQRFPVHVHIGKDLLEGEVTASRRYRSPNMAREMSGTGVRGTMYYVVPAQPGAVGPVSRTQTRRDEMTRIELTVRDAVRQSDRKIVLRAKRESDCGFELAMEDATTCGGNDLPGDLTVVYRAADNPDLIPGIYRGEFFIRGELMENSTVTRLFRLQVNLDTLK